MGEARLYHRSSCPFSTAQACSLRNLAVSPSPSTFFPLISILVPHKFNMASAVPPRLQVRKAFDFPPTPQYNGFSMELQPSPAFSTTPLRHHRESPTPSDDNLAKQDAPASTRLLRTMHFGRIILSVVLVAAGAAIVGCEAHALHTYNSTNLGSEWFLPLWPQNLDLRPSIAILVGGAVVALTNCFYLCCALLPAVSKFLAKLTLRPLN